VSILCACLFFVNCGQYGHGAGTFFVFEDLGLPIFISYIMVSSFSLRFAQKQTHCPWAGWYPL